METNEEKNESIDVGSDRKGLKSNSWLDKKNDVVEKARENPWMVASVVLGVLLIGFLVSGSGVTGGVITGGAIGLDKIVSADEAGEIIVDYLNGVAESEVELIDVNDVNGLYEVTVLYQDKEIPVYVTKDGLSYTSSLYPIMEAIDSSEPEVEDVPQTDKPVVELFIWGYCPYGVQAQGPLAEVASLLGDAAEFKTILYYDGHGAYETQQNKIQECIQKVSPEKYWDYAAGFVEDIYPVCGSSRSEECDLTESVSLMESLGIDSDAVLECVDSEGADLIAESSSYARSLGVTGSPTLFVNGVKVNVARTASAFQTAVCSGFTEENIPDGCYETLDSTAVAASGNC